MARRSLSSSPDPISILQDSSPARPERTGISSKTRGSNFDSPSKSIYLAGGRSGKQSPWRLKVTVQAEPTIPVSRNIDRKSRSSGGMTSTEEKPSPVRRRGRPRKSALVSDAVAVLQQRDDSPQRNPAPARKVHSRASTRNETSTTSVTESSQLERPSTTSRVLGRQQEERGRLAREEGIQERSVEKRDSLTNVALGEIGVDDNDDNMAPGDLTTYESEGFSMISVDSLSSHQLPGAIQGSPTAGSERADATALSYMPSSPPVSNQPLVIPVVQQSPKSPMAPVQSLLHLQKGMTPLRESAVRSGRVLQDIVRSPKPDSNVSASDKRDLLFDGFSATTRRQLRKSFQIGSNMAQLRSESKGQDDPMRTQSSSSGIAYPDLSHAVIDHRLPTPDDNERTNSKSHESETTPLYPRIRLETSDGVQSVSRRTYDDMSWVPTTSPSRPTLHRTAHDHLVPIMRNEVIELPSASSVDREEDGSTVGADQIINGREEQDIWQEEASRSIEDDVATQEVQDEVSALLDGNVAPRRSKIPATWRRSSGNHFYYSDSPEPEMAGNRKSSDAESSGKSSAGVATPPTSDEEVSVHDSLQENGLSKKELAHDQELEEADQDEVLSPSSESSSADGDDTGMFWQANLPNVFAKTKTSGLQHSELSMVSDLKPLSSPTRVDDTRLSQKTRSSTQKSKGTTSVLDSPLRKSLLKSSKLRDSSHFDGRSPVSQPQQPPNAQESDVDTSDIRQIRAEMAASRERSRYREEQNASLDSSDASFESVEEGAMDSTYIGHSRSYEENLNLSSPIKVKVKFNDSSVMASSSLRREQGESSLLGQSALSPRKKYHSLFDETAPLGGTELSVASAEELDAVKQAVADNMRPAQEEPTGLVSRMTNCFWSTVTSKASAKNVVQAETSVSSVRESSMLQKSSVIGDESNSESTFTTLPAGPEIAEIKQAHRNKASRESTTAPGAPLLSDQCLRLRRKYGLLNAQHPFTMQHARTLHRLHNSTRQHSGSTLVPATGSLSATLEPFVGQEHRSGDTGLTHVWTAAELHVVECFSALLVTDVERQRLERMGGGWGDEGAERAKGWDSKGRHGSWFAFAGNGPDDKQARTERGEIEAQWLVGVLGEIICREAAAAAAASS